MSKLMMGPTAAKGNTKGAPSKTKAMSEALEAMA
jgi:hypothetical protein